MKKALLFILISSCTCLNAAQANQNKLDLMLQPLAEKQTPEASKAFLGKAIAIQASDKVSSGKALASLNPEEMLVEILIKSDDPQLTRAAIEASGGLVRRIIKNIMIVQVPASQLKQLSNFAEVRFIEASKKLSYKMDTAIVHSNVDDLQTGTATGSSLTGKDVIVGIVDESLDYGHADFQDSSGGTRVQYVRQYNRSTEKFTSCVKAQIDADNCAITDRGQGFAHGTHVSGIAAGADDTYKGVAPAADIIFIFSSAINAEASGATNDVTSFSGAVLDGVAEVFAAADLMDKAAVVNLSLGTSLGAHDDSSLLEQGLNSLVGSVGRIIVNAAGNENVNTVTAAANIGGLHATVNVSAGIDQAWRFGVLDADIAAAGGSIVDAWFNKGDDCTIEARAYLANNADAITDTLAQVGPQSILADSSSATHNATDNTVELTMATAAADSNNERPHAQVALAKSSGASWSSIVGDGTSTGYVVDVVIRANTGSCTGSMWIYPDRVSLNDFFSGIDGAEVSGTNSYKLVDGDSDKTITIPGTASGVITVGSFMQEKPIGSGTSQWDDTNGDAQFQTNSGSGETGTGGTVDAVSAFSSLGPTGEISNSRSKPDLIAPGEPVIAALARGVPLVGNHQKRQVSDTHFKFEGTSMSAPHVTGIIALILEHNNTLTAAQMKALLTNNASLATANNVSGFGRVNAQAAVTNIAADTSGFAGIGDLSEDSTSNGSIGVSSSSGCSLGAANSTWAELAIILISLMFLIAHRKKHLTSGVFYERCT